MQQKLNIAGYSSVSTDGKFGSLTDIAVRNFQKSRGLIIDGKVGKRTLTALNN